VIRGGSGTFSKEQKMGGYQKLTKELGIWIFVESIHFHSSSRFSSWEAAETNSSKVIIARSQINILNKKNGSYGAMVAVKLSE
jgi:hypothetical protein